MSKNCTTKTPKSIKMEEKNINNVPKKIIFCKCRVKKVNKAEIVLREEAVTAKYYSCKSQV